MGIWFRLVLCPALPSSDLKRLNFDDDGDGGLDLALFE